MYHAILKGGRVTFSGTDAESFEIWKRANEGMEITIELVKRKPPVSSEMRGYMFGAVIPFLKRQVPDWGQLTHDQVYEILKKNFNYFEAYNPVTKRVERYGQSVMSQKMENEKAMAFVQEIATWVMDNYSLPLPDPKEFNDWKESAPLVGDNFEK